MFKIKIFFYSLFIFFFSLTSNGFSADLKTKNQEIDNEIILIKKQISDLQNKIVSLENKKKLNLKNTNEKIKIGLVLSGGGAKGFAHIGVLRELERNGIKIDYLTGSSMGAIVAALYSVGYTPDDIEQIFATTNIKDILAGNTNRRYIPLERKIDKNNSIIKLSYDNDLNFYLPKGLSDSNISYFTLKKLLWKAENIDNFSKLPIPLKIIATDINNGKAVALTKGDLARAVTASIAIPTLLDPIRIENTEYVDGLISRNFPVEDMLDMGADIIIGSDVGISLKDKKTSYNIVTIFNQLFSIYSSSSNESQKKFATIIISPEVSEYSPTDFSNMNDIIKKGELATQLKIKEISNYISPKQFYSKGNKVAEINLDSSIEKKSNKFILKKIIFENEKNIKLSTRNVINESFSSNINKTISKEDIEKIFDHIHAFDSIDKIFYKIDSNKGVITIDLDQSPTNFLAISGNYGSDYGTTFKLNTDILYSGKLGSITSLNLEFGDYYGAEIKNFSYYGLSNKFGLISSLSYNQSPLLLYHHNDKVAKYLSQDVILKLALATQFNNEILIEYGTNLNSSTLSLDTGNFSLNQMDYTKQYGNLFFNISYDTLNNSVFPSKGIRGDLIYTWGGASLDESSEHTNYNGPVYSLKSYFPITKKLSLFSGIEGGIISGDSILPTKFIKLGGNRTSLKRNEISFAGYRYQNILVDQAFVGNLGFHYKLLDKLYFITTYNVGTFSEASAELYANNHQMWNDYINGIEVGVAYNSYIGPISLSLSKNSDNDSEVLVQFNLGYYLD